jgi:hypothetical protein
VAHNLFIAYDLIDIGKNYDGVRDAIKSLGRWYQFQFSLFYVSTPRTVSDAHAIVRAAMDADDRLCVIEATSAYVSAYPKPDIDAVNFAWFTP